jgi:NAD(P)-dependent dehydrogenase (short-subunit alcohol dehydrogenase family)
MTSAEGRASPYSQSHGVRRIERGPGPLGQEHAPMADVDGKVGFISGGSSGIGLGIAEAFAEAGMSIVIGYRSRQHLDEAMGVLARFGKRVYPVELEVADRRNLANAADDVIERFGKVHVVVANAGVAVLKPFSEATYQDWDWQLGVNLTGVFNTIHVFLPLIRAHGEGGQIVATSSVMGLFTARNHALYSATKFGVLGLMEGLRLDLRDPTIGVSVYCPGNVWANLEVRTGQAATLANTDAVAATTRARLRGHHADIAMEPIEAGRLVLEGIRRNALYILTHSEFGHMIEERHKAIEAAHPHVGAPSERVEFATATYHHEMYAHERERSTPPRSSV